MKNKKFNEIIMFFAVVIIVLLFYHLKIGIKNLIENSTIEINIHDTHYVIQSLIIFIPLLIMIYYLTYFVRIIFEKFKNKTANFIFLFFNLINIILVGTYFWQMISLQNSSEQDDELGDYYGNTNKFLIIVLLIFTFTFIFVSIKTKKLVKD